MKPTLLFKSLLSDIFHALLHVWADVKNKKALAVLVIPIISTCLIGAIMPIFHDEAYTYLTFSRKSFYASFAFYPCPNNHILHSLLTNISIHIPFLPTIFALRIPAIFASILSWAIAYSFIKRYSSEKTAIFVVGIFSVLNMSLLYNAQARGYSMLILFFVIALHATYKIITSEGQSKYWNFFVISSILGFYTIPTFLYPFITLNVLILIFRGTKELKRQIIYNSIIVLVVFLLYAPIIIRKGIGILTSNQFVKPISRSEVLDRIFPFFDQVLIDIFSIPGAIVLVVLVAAIVVSFINKDKNTIILWMVFLGMPFILLLLQSVIPFTRTFIYYAFILVFLISLSFRKYIDGISIKWLLAGVFAIQITSIIHFGLDVNERLQKATALFDFITEKDNQSYYIGSPGLPELDYELLERGKKKKSMLVDYCMPASADTIYDFDYVIMFVKYDKTLHREPSHQNDYIKVYTK